MPQPATRDTQVIPLRPKREVLPLETLLAEITARREEFDRLHHVPRDMVATMKRAGIYRASTPRCFGGDALPPHAFLRTVERIAEVDGSAGWVAAFGSANIYLASLPYDTQAEIYATGPNQVFAGGLYPMHPATPEPGGWRVTGQWHFASGCMGADWIGVGLGVENPAQTPALIPRMGVSRASEVEIVETWNVVGMQGTGSHDTSVTNKFYPQAWTCSRHDPGVIDEPLYRYPALAYQAQVHAVCNLGLARAALDLALSMSGVTATNTGAPRLADRPYFRIELARSEAQLRAARAFFYETAEQAWDMLLAGDPVPQDHNNLLRLSATHAAHTGADVIRTAYRIAGLGAIYDTNRLQRIVRDSMVVTQHAFLNEGTFDGAGALLAGIRPAMPYP